MPQIPSASAAASARFTLDPAFAVGEVNVRHEVHPGGVGHRTQVDAFGQCRVCGQVPDRRDHHCLLRLGREPGRCQPPLEVTGSVVGVCLPFELAPKRGEVPYLGSDRRIRRVLVEVRPEDAVPVVIRADLPHDVAVTLDTGSSAVGPRVAPQLAVEQGTYFFMVHPAHFSMGRATAPLDFSPVPRRRE
ncbi:hypothetical protein SANTM175S_09308 [Streptomyces antimycoticus]